MTKTGGFDLFEDWSVGLVLEDVLGGDLDLDDVWLPFLFLFRLELSSEFLCFIFLFLLMTVPWLC